MPVKGNRQPSDRTQTRRTLWIICGFIFTGVGFVGIFVPLLPTTVFLLLAAACFNRGSSRFHHWLLHNKLLGPYIEAYQQKSGIPRKVLYKALILLWLTLGASIWIVSRLHVTLILLAVGIGVSIFLLTRKIT